MSDADRAAVVVAGGHSRRFGDAEKATATVDGTPLLRRVVERVDPLVDHVVVNCRRAQHREFERILDGTDIDVRFARDRVPGGGPVTGMAVGLDATDASAVTVLSCDLPFVDREVVAGLFETAERTGRAAVPFVSGCPQPLCAVYRREAALDACGAALAAGDASARGVVGRVDSVPVPVERPRVFRDVDTRDALERVRETDSGRS